MLQRTIPHSPGMLIFTADYSEYVRGRIDHGATVTILYDPRRIVPRGDSYTFGDPNQPIKAFVQFQSGGPITTIPLAARAGAGAPLQANTPAGGPMLSAPMLTGSFQMPDNSDIITIWFTITTPDGQTHYDSNNSDNYVFHLHHANFNLVSALVSGPLPAPNQTLTCQIAADQDVSKLQISYQVTNVPGGVAPRLADLLKTGQSQDDGRLIWSTGAVSVPCNAVIAFAVVYTTEGYQTTDNNQNMFYIAATADKIAQVSGLL